MEFLNEIFINWTSVIMPDTIKITFGGIICLLLILIFIDTFRWIFKVGVVFHFLRKTEMKKIIAVSVGVLGVLSALPTFAANYINIGSASSTDLFAFASGLFSDLWLLIAIAIGVPLAFYVIKKVIALIPKR